MQLIPVLSCGEMNRELANMKSGNLSLSRWLTTGTALMFLWISNHGFTGENWEKLTLLVTYVVQVYFPMYFEIKVKHLIAESPQDIVTHLRLMRQQSQLAE